MAEAVASSSARIRPLASSPVAARCFLATPSRSLATSSAAAAPKKQLSGRGKERFNFNTSLSMTDDPDPDVSCHTVVQKLTTST